MCRTAWSNAMLLEKCLQFALPGCYERFGALGCAIGAAPADSSDAAAADALLAAVKQLCRTCEVPSPEQYGISRTAFFDVIEKDVSRCHRQRQSGKYSACCKRSGLRRHLPQLVGNLNRHLLKPTSSDP